VSGGGENRTGVDASAGRGVQAGDHNTQVNSFSGDQSRLEASGGRDVLAAGRDLTVNNYSPAGTPTVTLDDAPAAGPITLTFHPWTVGAGSCLWPCFCPWLWLVSVRSAVGESAGA
jgi:hypothetical protein